MSDDEIRFDDVTYREPQRRCRPDRDRRWASLAYEVPAAIDLPVFLDRATADAIERHALSDTSVELGGILLGTECLDEATGLPFVLITRSLQAKHYENTQASFTYTHDSWEEITRERDRLHPDLDIVGWYHTHPDFGIFLSSHDLFLHHNFFSQPLQVAYVVDPIRQTRGFFQWRDGAMVQVGGFYLYADRGERAALTRLVNDLENLPNTEGGGGGLSPRLEAELIHMLTRPAAPHTSAADHAQAAALFGMLGAVAGVLAFAGALWIYTLNKSMAEQGQQLAELKRIAGESSDSQRVLLDRLFNESNVDNREKFTAAYRQVVRELDEAKSDLTRSQTRERVLNDRARSLTRENDDLQKDLAKNEKTLDAFQKEAKESPDLITQLRKLRDESAEKSKKIHSLEELYDAASDKQKAAELVQKYHRTWYVALAGWTLGLLMTLGVITLLAQPKGLADVSAEPQHEEPPPHRIS